MSLFDDHRASIERDQFSAADGGAAARAKDLRRHRYYYDEIKRVVRAAVPDGQRVLCIRSDAGQYLAWVKPSRGVGVEISERLNALARANAPGCEFLTAGAQDFEVDGAFDTVLIVNAVNELFDVQATLERARDVCAERGQVVIVFYNFLWQPLVQLAEALRLKRQQPKQNWLSFGHVSHLLRLSGFEPVERSRSILCPFGIPGLAWLFNRCVARLPLIEKLGMVQTVVARPTREPDAPRSPTVSVIVPCKNERGNIEEAVLRTPEMGAGTELIFCDDRSTDGTGDEVRRMQQEHPERDIRLVEGPGISKAENVWTGFDAAKNDIVMILDGDLAVAPEELPKFVDALARGRAQFANGTRMVYPMRGQAMRLANLFGNKLFGMLFTHILGKDISDTLCGTKALWRDDYKRMKPLRGTWGIRDRWGDYELIFGAAALGLERVDVPVHYMERTYGETKMTGRLKNAWIMLRMCKAAFFKLKRRRS